MIEEIVLGQLNCCLTVKDIATIEGCVREEALG